MSDESFEVTGRNMSDYQRAFMENILCELAGGRRQMAQLLMPEEGEASLDDVLLSWAKFRGPSPMDDPNWVAPKRTWRIRFRIWKHNANHAVQQWIHDHLTEAYCDC